MRKSKMTSEGMQEDFMTTGTLDETQTFESMGSCPVVISAADITHEILTLTDYTIPKLPKIINHYLFGNVVGEGSFGKVKEVVEETTLVKRAVKIVRHSNIMKKKPNKMADLTKEVRIMKRVNHHNVVRLTDVFTIDEKEKTYIVMEYCIGSVEQLIKATVTKYLTEADAHFLFVQLIDGLEYLHSYSIIHNDIKPANLLLNCDFVLKICDFGEAEELPCFQSDDFICTDRGTPYFKPPEVVNDQVHWSGSKVDIFAAGVTLYFMVTGKPPWDDDEKSIVQLFEKICNIEYKLPKELDLSSDFKRLLASILEKNPYQRATIAEIKAHDWMRTHFDKEYARFRVTNYDEFYPKSLIKQMLEQLYGEPPLFFDHTESSCEDDFQVRFSKSDPEVSPIKYREAFTATTPRSKSHAPRRRPTFFKWFRYGRRG